MMNELTFDDLRIVLRHSTSSSRLQGRTEDVTNIHVPTVGVKNFVAPNFKLGDPGLLPETQVILVSAPAAMGKSSIAKQLGFETRNILWDLSRFSLGSAFFSGVLADVFGSKGLDDVREGLKSGSLTLILDAADEALVRAGAASFGAAIKNLTSLIGGASADGPSAVILGRPDTIEATSQILLSNNVRTQTVHVAFFTDEQAREFVLAKAKKDDHAGIAASELNEFLDDFFAVVGSAVEAESNHASRSFLGYAPVLDALGAFYREEVNPARRLAEIKQAHTSAHIWDLLLEVVESIMSRESEKFGRSFGGENPSKVEFGRAAYDQAAQLELLLSDEPDEIEVSPPDFPDAEESWVFDELTPAIRAWYQEHPFLQHADNEPNPLLRFASTVFRDFALASSLRVASPDDAPRLLDLWLDPRVMSSPILSRFCFSENLHLKTISPDMVAVVASSHSSGFSESSRLEIDVHEDDEGDDSAVVSLVLREGPEIVGEVKSRLAKTDPLSLSQRIARTVIDAPDVRVIIGKGSQECVIGPDVSINCTQFDVQSAEVRVNMLNDKSNELRTDRIIGTARSITGAGHRGLNVTVPSAVFPWQAYRVDTGGQDSPSANMIYWAGMDVRRNFKWFVRGSLVGGGLNYPAKAMEAILNKGRASVSVHDFLIERKYLQLRGETWSLNLPRISGVTVMANDTEDENYRRLLLDFLTWDKGQSTEHARGNAQHR